MASAHPAGKWKPCEHPVGSVPDNISGLSAGEPTTTPRRHVRSSVELEMLLRSSDEDRASLPSPRDDVQHCAEQGDDADKDGQIMSRVASFSKYYTIEEEKAIVRIFDRRLVLFLALLYMLSFLDRSSQPSDISQCPYLIH